MILMERVIFQSEGSARSQGRLNRVIWDDP